MALTAPAQDFITRAAHAALILNHQHGEIVDLDVLGNTSPGFIAIITDVDLAENPTFAALGFDKDALVAGLYALNTVKTAINNAYVALAMLGQAGR